jgi:hypothetical protein
MAMKHSAIAHSPAAYWSRAWALTLIAVAALSASAPAGAVRADSLTQPIELRGGIDTTVRDPFRKECLKIESSSRPHVVDPHVYDHIVAVQNKCMQSIKVHICYYKSDHCVDLSVPGFTRKMAYLGSYPAMPIFRYTYKEIH